MNCRRNPDTVNVYASADAKHQGKAPIRQLRIIPKSIAGMDSYSVNKQLLKGYVDSSNGADACVFLECGGF